MHRLASSPLFRGWFIDATPGAWSIPERPRLRARIASRVMLGACVFIFALLGAVTLRSFGSATTGYAALVLVSLPIIAYWYARPRFVFRADEVDAGAFREACEAVLAEYRAVERSAVAAPSGERRAVMERARMIASSAATQAWSTTLDAEANGLAEPDLAAVTRDATAQMRTLQK